MLFLGEKENLEHEEVQYAKDSNGDYWYEAIMMIKNNTKETINKIRVDVKLFDNKMLTIDNIKLLINEFHKKKTSLNIRSTYIQYRFL